ncbi:hypothetical protein IFM89_036687 [Coptis chinensis]|uniref:AtC3H46-like PABC-like domain-containing protein n=1 Tax=Coptis chinensis TaxID=261450 RepID=A0A835M2Q4_9MAGN|nr:hypothetical protein IFM89_036687 [Coptis chinensis]
MDAYEATRIVFSRIQSIDPENAAKIMGFFLIQDHGDKEMIHLAFGPESLVHSLILKACNELGLFPTASPFFPLSRQNSSRLLHSHSSASSDFNVLSPNGFHHNVKNNHIDEFHLQDHLSFLDEGPKDPDLFFPSSDFATDTDAMFFNSPPPNWGVNNE